MSNFFSRYWRLLVVAVLLALFAYGLLLRGLGSLIPAYSHTELAAQQSALSLHSIYHNPVNAPYKIIVWVGLKLGHHSILVTRVAAAAFAGVFAVLFYWVAFHWYSRRVALLASILFVTSSGFLHVGRYGTALVMQMATLLLISCVFLYRRSPRETFMAYMLTIVLAICLYIPGMIWFELIGLWLLRKRLILMFAKRGMPHSIAIFVLGTCLVLPLLWAGLHDLNVLRAMFGVPAVQPTPRLLLENGVHLGSSIIYRGYWPAEYWLEGAPLLNVGEVIIFLAGLSQLVQRPILRANYFLLGALTVGTCVVLLGGATTTAILVPLIYLTIAGGIFYLLDQWLTIFPRNPIARFIGVSIIFIFASFSALYHMRAYFTAWPNAPETKAVYSVKQPS